MENIENTEGFAPKNNLEEGKPLTSTLPLDLLQELLAPAYAEGLKKYHRESWRKGFMQSVMMDALMHHLIAYFYCREDFDPDALENFGIKKHHLGAVLFCCICMYNDWKNFPEHDDRPEITWPEER